MGDSTLKKMVRDLVTLEVITRVGDANVDMSSREPKFVPEKNDKEKVFYTRIDLIDCDIYNSRPHPGEVDPGLQEIHDKNVDFATNEIDRRLEILIRVARRLGKDLGEIFGLPAGDVNPEPPAEEPKK
jgi:hypothetical protein